MNQNTLILVLLFIVTTSITFMLIYFVYWLVRGPSLPPESPIKSAITTPVEQPPNFTGVKVHSKPEVFNVKDHLYSFSEAENVCRKYNSKLATKQNLEQAQKDGANWCNLGWLIGQEAYYPTQQQQVDAAKKWPIEFRNGCGNVGINGGFYPATLKLAVNCYGVKPMDLHSINPWNTINKKWSNHSSVYF